MIYDIIYNIIYDIIKLCIIIITEKEETFRIKKMFPHHTHADLGPPIPITHLKVIGVGGPGGLRP